MRVSSRLAEIVHTTENLVVLRRVAEELGRLNPGDESAIAALEQLIPYLQPLRNRIKAIKSLIAVDPQNSLIISSLLEIIDLDEAEVYVLRDAIWVLRNIAVRNESVIKAIAEFLHRRQQYIEPQLDEQQSQFHADIFLCNQSAELLGVIGVVVKLQFFRC